jgi:hypothetical protein
MLLNVNEKVRRAKEIRLLRKIRDLKSFAIRTRVANSVLGHSWSTVEFDALLSDKILQGAIVVAFRHRKNRRAGRPLKGRLTRVHRKFRPGRPPRLYRLTRIGCVVLRRLEKQQAADRAAQVQAKQEAAQARASRATARAESKIKREAEKIQRDLREASRQAALVITGAGKGIDRPEPLQAPYVAPRTAPAPPRPYPGPVVASPAGFNRPAPIGGPNLIDRIKAARFRVNDRGEVFFDNRWIAVDEWMRRNGSVLDRKEN